MAYLLQPDLKRITSDVIPRDCADDVIMNYPQSTSLNNCCRPSTMVYGTAPYMAGKGAPNELIEVSDELRPQATTRFDRVYVNTVAKNTFPWQNMKCSLPLRTIGYEPSSTRADKQNGLFAKRYCNN